MAGWVERFWQDKRGTSFEGLAFSVSIIAVGFVASADLLDYLTKTHKGDIAKLHAATTMVADNKLDYTPTSTLPKLYTRSVLDPCTGAAK